MNTLTPSALRNELSKAFEARTEQIIKEEIEATMLKIKARLQEEAAKIYVNIITHDDWDSIRAEMNIKLSFTPVNPPLPEVKT